ncbi:MAG TPA: MerR family transcriptional regulator [Gaiellaceae bacterium]|nr:MerR family transcriptional regulator [Gaiellaceae bacterium]
MLRQSRPIYSIGAVARLVGVTPGTIRAWEERYGVISPKRTSSGRRLYSHDEVEWLRFVKTKIDEGIQPADAHRLLEERAEAGADAAEQATYGDRRPLVLVAERDPYAADLMEHFLREEGYDVDVASDAVDAERRFAGLSPQLAIVELLLSGGQGADLCRRLKARRAVPVLAVSALNARDAALAAGADAFLQKPLDPLVLVSTVNDLLASSPLAEAEAEASR